MSAAGLSYVLGMVMVRAIAVPDAAELAVLQARPGRPSPLLTVASFPERWMLLPAAESAHMHLAILLGFITHH